MTVPETAGRSFRTFRCQGWEILVGKGARDNDVLTFEVAERGDVWLHVAEWSGSHVVIRVGETHGEPPREVVEFAARLAAWHSKARGARGKVEVHVCRAGDVRKPPRFAPGKVQLSRWTAVKVYAKQPPPESTGD
jgi:predicted ribosome quality control (RQC) complex YloA/Tae2 family protein